MAACSSSQMGLAAPTGTYRTLQGHLYGGRCCLGEDLAQACAESIYFPGRTIIVAKELFITVLPKRDSWGRMLVWALLFPVRTLLHTHHSGVAIRCMQILLWHKSWGLFSKEVTYTGGRKNAALTTVSPHLMQKPGGLPTNCHNFFMNSSGLTAWLSLWPYKQTLMLMWLHSLWLALDSPPFRKQPPYSFKAHIGMGRRKLILEKSGLEFVTLQESHPHRTQSSLAPCWLQPLHLLMQNNLKNQTRA